MSQKTVLVIEDSPELAESLFDVLEMEGYNAVIALNGRDGVTQALALHPDLILLDIRLPDIDGYKVFQKIRADVEWGTTAKVLILTASESIENISKNVDLPVEYVLFKPEMSISQLVLKIKDRLKD
ncbi:MAG: response regulator [Candidatus Pacebacteria bacterium]|nr:response regulator [Candidatus Paceibacterota bacterium]MBP9842685.1 response regulator [Candidatus Paceibacterota bacterium]